MSHSVYFFQECPTCGRSLEIRVDFLGRDVACPHCRGHFIAADSSSSSVLSDSGIMLQRADELIAQAERRKAVTPHSNGYARTP
jgi:DNA-directed RNA polymerase subunit RPC12/RpoP